MGRGATKNAEYNTGIGREQNQQLFGQSQGILNTLTPQLTQESQTGLPQSIQDAMRTHMRQGLGGANASAAGQGALMEARTRNAGAATPAIEESVRDAMRQGSQNEMSVDLANELDRERAQSGLGQLFGQTGGLANNALGLSNQAIGDWVNSSAQTTNAWQENPFLKSALGLGSAKAGQALGLPCYIAAVLYGGWDEPRTVAIRTWLMNDFGKRWYGAPILELYRLTGKTIASYLERHEWAKAIFRPIFDAALRHANG